MGVKSLTLLGLVVSSAFVYLCIESKKDSFYALAHKDTPPQPVAQQEQAPSPVVKPEAPKAQLNPSFAYISGVKSKIAALLSTHDKSGEITNMIKGICGDDGCVKDIKYSDDIKEFEFTEDILNLINHSIDKDVDNFSIYMDKNSIKLDGVAANEEDVKSFLEKTKHFSQKMYKVENSIHTKKEKPEEKSVVTKKQEPKKETNSTTEIVVKESIENQAKIVKIEKNTTTTPKPKATPVHLSKPVPKQEHNSTEAKKVETETIENKASVIKTIIKEEKKVKKPVKKAAKKKIIKPKPKHVSKPVAKSPKVIKEVSAKDIFVIPNQVDPQEASFRIEDLLYAEPIMFDPSSNGISSESQSTLNKISDIILGLDGVSVKVKAYSSSSQGRAYDKVLSQKRADMVKRALVKSGVRSSIIKTAGYSNSDFNEVMDLSNTVIKIEIKEGR